MFSVREVRGELNPDEGQVQAIKKNSEPATPARSVKKQGIPARLLLAAVPALQAGACSARAVRLPRDVQPQAEPGTVQARQEFEMFSDSIFQFSHYPTPLDQ